MAFAHLHVHTQYSFLDGAIRVPDLAKAAAEAGMGAVAMTDRGNLYGAIELQKSCRKAGVKPIFGCEVSVVETDCSNPADRRTTPLVLLAESLEGYRNLIAAVSHSWLEGWHNDMPRADRTLLSRYRAGLVALSGGIGGDVAQAILRGDLDRARDRARAWRDVFGPDGYFLQVEDLGFEECATVNEHMLALAEELGLRVVATNYCRYLRKEDAPAHAALMCIGMGRSYSALSGTIPDAMWFKPEPVMRECFASVPEAVDNAALLAERCNVEIPLGKTHLPRYRVPEGYDLAGYLREKSREGLRRRLEEMDGRDRPYDRRTYAERLETELDIIIGMDFPGYFLIVWDFIAKAREMGVPVGPGRGSGAGSLVAYALRITDIDPIAYGLLFERFLNPERVSMPDFDIDFCMNKRDLVIRYVSEKYGAYNVGQIITYGSMKAKAALRDVGRVLGLSFGDVDVIAKLVPEELNITLSQALEKEPRLRDLLEKDERYRALYDMALRLEGLTRHAGLHAAGIVISEDVLWSYVPICRGAGGEIVTQFAKDEVELAGLVKFDFLGLKTLTVIDHAVRIVNETRAEDSEPFDLGAIPMDDRKVFELLSSGETTGVFQLESSGFKELMKQLRPDCFEDVVAAVALYRPGPLGSGMVADFVKRKHGETAVVYPHPALKDVLAETYGVIVYQEQVMSIARSIAGYTLGGADKLRRAMGKKKPEEMKEQRDVFLEGAARTAIAAPEVAEQIFDTMAYFAGYGFNKSHSAAYALISYQTAYLKAHYPVELMAALLTADGDNTDKVVRYIGDARAHGIVVRPPDMNLSQKDFSVDSGGIRFGLGAIKNVGEGAVDTIIQGRSDGRYRSLFDFVDRVDLRRVNRRVVEALIKSGACDCFGQERHVLFHNVERALERAQNAQRDRETGQQSLFALLGGTDGARAAASGGTYLTDCEFWPDRKRLELEKEAIGFYVSGHPLDSYAHELVRYSACNIAALDRVERRGEVTIGGVVVALREKVLRTGDGRMAFVTIEDLSGQVEVAFYKDAYGEAEEALKSGEPLLVNGAIRLEGDETKTLRLRGNKAVRLGDIRREKTRRIAFVVDASRCSPADVHRLRDVCTAHAGECSVVVRVVVPGTGTATLEAGGRYSVDPNQELVGAVERILGKGSVLMG